jgi:hypothetical protein
LEGAALEVRPRWRLDAVENSLLWRRQVPRYYFDLGWTESSGAILAASSTMRRQP